jgi:cytochrome c oxidase subunit 1
MASDVLLFWIIFFEMAVLDFGSAVLLNCRLATPRFAWLGFWLMVAGAGHGQCRRAPGRQLGDVHLLPADEGPAALLSRAHHLRACGALIGCFVFFGTLIIAREERTYEGSIPLVTFGALTAAIIAVFTIASGAIILIPTFLWSVGLIGHHRHRSTYKLVWWAMGHSSQQINVSAHVAVWYAIAAIVLGAKPLSEKVSRMAFFMYILFLQLASAHHMLVEPGVSSEWKIVNTSYMMYLAVMGSMVHGMTVPGAIEAAQREKGYTSGLFEWLRKAPWGNPAFAGMFLSLVMLRLPRRHLGRRARHRAAQHPHAQHALCARPLPCHGGRRHDADLHGGDLPAGSRLLQARDHLADRGPLAALPLRLRGRRHLALHDGRRHARVPRRHWTSASPTRC